METAALKVKSLPNYRLKIYFANGSVAVVDLKNRIKTLRFHVLADPKVFSGAKLAGDRITWPVENSTFEVFINDLLDTMLME